MDPETPIQEPERLTERLVIMLTPSALSRIEDCFDEHFEDAGIKFTTFVRGSLMRGVGLVESLPKTKKQALKS
jgi:hypothetical protein